MRYVAYRRVSTVKQGQSGLGLEAQDVAIKAHVGDGEIVANYTEVETGKVADRPELQKAMAHARRIKATLAFAKLDRLARNARFLLSIVESGASVVFCDFPSIPEGPTGKFILTQMAAVAELEAGLIAQRTKGALAAAKARGTLLGAARPGAARLSPEASHKGAVASAIARKEQAREAYADLRPWLQELRDGGLSLRQMADRLNAEGHTTRQGKAFNNVQCMRILAS